MTSNTTQITDRIARRIADAGLDAILISSNPNILYTSERVFRGYVYITADSRVLRFIIRPLGITDPTYIYIRKPEQILEALASAGLPAPANIGLEFGTTTYSDILRLQKALAPAATHDASHILADCRMVKTPHELDLMRQDGLHQAAAYRQIGKLYRKDMTDIELQIEIEDRLRREGCLGFHRVAGSLMEINMGSVLAGDNADAPTPYEFAMGGRGADPSLPGGADGTILRRGMTVMVDMNGCFNAYQTDMTRVWRIGEIPQIAYDAHECSRRILRTLEKEAVPGAELSALYQTGLDIVNQAGLSQYYMGHSQQAAFIGHGVGIELNELPVITPRSKHRLEAGMTLAIEPKFVIPGTGAVGVENTYVVTPSGLECITPFPEEIAEF